jgi:hypothetical protein
LPFVNTLYLLSDAPPENLPQPARGLSESGLGGIFARVNMPLYKHAYEKNGGGRKNLQKAPKTFASGIFRSADLMKAIALNPSKPGS